MKTNKSLIALCLSIGLLTSAPGVSLADVNYVPQNTSDAPAIPSAALQQLTWTPVDQSKTQTTQLATGGQQLGVPGISGPVAVYNIPANIDELAPTLISEVNKQASVPAPNVLILDQNMTPSAFSPSSCFTYQESDVMGADRLEGTMRLTPALGQQKLYILVFTTEKGLQQTTQLLDLAKTYARNVGNLIPDIPDPVTCHTADGLLESKMKTNFSSSVLVGPLFGSSAPAPVTVGNAAAPAVAAPAPAPVKKSEPMFSDMESYFNTAIKNAVARGDVNKTLKLSDEAEHLGLRSARSTSINSIKDRG